MFNAKYLVCLNSKSFDPVNYGYACLGAQLLELVNFLDKVAPPHTWYGADLDARANLGKIQKYTSGFLRRIGDLEDIKVIANTIDQFIWGVFIAIQKGMEISDDLIEVAAEDITFKPIDINGIIIEIKAFDRTHFQIYSDNFNLMQLIAEHFKGEIEESTSK